MGKQKKILCIDDEQINLLILEKILGKKYNIITALSGAKALDILNKDSEIELIIADMSMPEMNGLEFIKEANKQFENKKFFMFSGYAITEEIQEAIDDKLILDYFQKPANFDAMDQSLSQHI